MTSWLAIAVVAAALAYDPAAPAAAPKTVALGLVALVFLALALPAIARGDRPMITKATAAWCALTGWLALSLGWSEHPEPASVALFGATLALAFAGAGLPLPSLKDAAARAAMATALVSAAVAGWQAGSGAPVHGLHGNSGWLGLVLATAWPLCVERARDGRGVERWLALGSALAATAGLVVSGSRTSWLAAGAGALWLLTGRWRWASAAAALGVAVYAVRFTDWSQAWEGRMWIWRMSLDAGLLHPLRGHGAGGFAFAYLDAQGRGLAALPLDVASTRFVNATTAHHDLLHLFVDGGAVAAVLVIAALGASWWDLRRVWPGGSALALVVLLAGLGDVPLQQPAVLALLALVLGAGPRRAASRIDGAIAMAALLVPALLLPRSAATWIGERRMTRALEAPLRERTIMLTRAVETAPHAGDIALELGLAHLALGEPARALPWLERARVEVANVGTDVALGNAHLALGDPAAAVDAFEAALARQPARFAARANLVEALRQAGRLDDAQRELERARELQPNHPKLGDMAERLRRARIDAQTSP